MLAKDDIEEGEVLFTVPRVAILDQGSSKVADVLYKGNCSGLLLSVTCTVFLFCFGSFWYNFFPFPLREDNPGGCIKLGSFAPGSAL